MIQNSKIAATRRSIWNRVRLQLGGGLTVAVVLPYLARYSFEQSGADLTSLWNSLIATSLALVLGYYGFRRVSHFPGVRASNHIIPLFSAAYGAALAGFFFFRLDYSRLHFALSFALSIVWFYVVYFMLRRQQRLRIGIVPFGETGGVAAIPNVDWVRLSDVHVTPEGLDGIVADLRADIPDEWERFLTDRTLDGMLVMHVKQIEESLTGRVSIEHLSENNLGSLIPGIIYSKFKRAIDFATALVALPLLTPFLLLVAFLIKRDSPGPVLFRQERIGYRGERFRMLKFRTMTHVPPDAHGDARIAAMTQDEDKRVTRLGRALRHYRIDELPQIVNVIRGEMSWIGPRPEAIPLSQWYERELPFYRYRHIVRPGITGWAQVRQGHVAEVSEVLGKLHYDFYYIRNFSFWLDVLIVAGTIRTMLSGFGSR